MREDRAFEQVDKRTGRVLRTGRGGAQCPSSE